MMRGTLYIVAAPSGAGKSSIVNAVLKRVDGVVLSISYTSRAARPGERHAQHYHFINKTRFEQMIAEGQFFEYALVHKDYKGTARNSVLPLLEKGLDVLLEIDWQGARQVREQIPEAKSIFILPPSMQALENRMRNRGQDSEATIAARLAGAREEMSHYHEFDFVVINEHFDQAVQEVTAIFTAQRLQVEQQTRRHQALIEHLLSD